MHNMTNHLSLNGRFLPILFVVIIIPLLSACLPPASLEQPANSATATTSRVPPVTKTGAPATPTPFPPATSEPRIYEVRVGDNLTFIAGRFATTAAAIQIANELLDANALVVGQELVIPGAGQARTPAPNNDSLSNAAKTVPEIVVIDRTATPPPDKEDPDEYDRGVTHNRFLCPAELEPVPEGAALVGRSAVCRLPILAYRLGNGETPLILVGGIHGGYEWNTILLAEKMRDYLLDNPDLIPPALSIYLIPNANPDGLYAVTSRTGSFDPPDDFEATIPGRFNGRYVDLNRNWDCQWQPEALWGNTPVSGGSAPFSEPETQALRDFFLQIDPAAVLFWHSAAVGVYPAGCSRIDPASKELADLYGSSAGYEVHDSFDHYAITGDAGNWLASKGIPSITVELTTHGSLDWEMNLAGLEALMRPIQSLP